MKIFVASYQHGSDRYGVALYVPGREIAEQHARRLGLTVEGELAFSLPSWVPTPIVSLLAWVFGLGTRSDS